MHAGNKQLNAQSMLINWNILNNLRNTNDIIPINRLPPELLIQIWSLNARCGHLPFSCEIWADPTVSQKVRPQLRDILNASYVCFRWRSIIISCPELWSHFIDLDPKNASFARIILERSKTYPIIFSERRCLTWYSLKRNMKHASRVVALHFSTDITTKEWSLIPDVKFPRLRFLSVDRHHYGGSLSDTFPGPATPVLESLHLRGCFINNISQLSTLRPTLTHLQVESLQHNLPTCNEWLHILSDLPLLRNLLLANAISYSCTKEAIQPRLSPLHLQLEAFEVYSFSPACINFLSNIVIAPSCTNISIKEIEEFDYKRKELFVSWITNVLTTLAQASNTFDKCLLRMGTGVIICFPLSNISDNYQPLDEVAAGRFRLEFAPDAQLSSQLLRSFQPLYNKIHIVDPIPGQHFEQVYSSHLQLLQQLPKLHTIISASPSFMRGLISFIDQKKTHSSLDSIPILPTVENLHFTQVVSDTHISYEELVQFYSDFVRFYTYKDHSGYPLRTVINAPKNVKSRTQ